MEPGTEVGAHRWPNQHAHPDCWEQPHKGILLSKSDPRAWSDTLAFPGREPTWEETTAHVASCESQGILDDFPVLWEWGVTWESVHNIRPYADDVADWEDSKSLKINS